jgi:lysophospholipase L1-like esterase
MIGTSVKITLAGDDTTQGNETEGKARVGIYVNGRRVIDTMIEQPKQTIPVFESSEPQEITVRIMKLSECAMSVIGIADIEAETEGGIHPTAKNERAIEFVGDSITCGFGVDLEDPDTQFQTNTEDVTRAYAYKTAQKLHSDYSMVCFSGYGILSGYTDMDIRQVEQLVPNYYEKIGFSYGRPFGTFCLQDVVWDFSRYQPDLVVINLGTNDDSYCKEDTARRQQFTEKYVEFLGVIRKNNPQATILCIVGLMGERIYPAVESAVEIYSTNTAETNVYAMKLTEQIPEDGLVSCSHPTEISHEKTAVNVADKIKKIMNW